MVMWPPAEGTRVFWAEAFCVSCAVAVLALYLGERGARVNRMVPHRFTIGAENLGFAIDDEVRAVAPVMVGFTTLQTIALVTFGS